MKTEDCRHGWHEDPDDPSDSGCRGYDEDVRCCDCKCHDQEV